MTYTTSGSFIINLYDIAFVLLFFYLLIKERFNRFSLFAIFYFFIYFIPHLELWRLFRPILYFFLGLCLAGPKIHFSRLELLVILSLGFIFNLGTNEFRTFCLLLFIPLDIVSFALLFIYGMFSDDRSLELGVLLGLFFKFFGSFISRNVVFLFSISLLAFYLSLDLFFEFFQSDVGLAPRLLEFEEIFSKIQNANLFGTGVTATIVSTSIGVDNFVDSYFSHNSVPFILLRFGLFGLLIYLIGAKKILLRSNAFYLICFIIDSFSGSLIHPAVSLTWGLFIGSDNISKK
jgi:hypothetical protein